MSKSFDYVILSQQSWDVEIGSNAKNIAMEISKKHRVLYINRPLDMQTLLKRDVSNASFVKNRISKRNGPIENQITEVSKNLFAFTPTCILQSINGLPDGKIYDLANKYNNGLLAKEIKRALQHLNIADYVLLNDGELFNGFYMNELLNAKKNLYYFRDYFLAVPYWQKHGIRLEPKLFERYDGVVCNSEYLAEIASKHNPNTMFVGQGCDYSYFEKITTDSRYVIKPTKPVIGYVGALNSIRLDVSLLENLAHSNPQWQWVFVGPEDDAFRNSKLHNLRNVTFTGPKKQEELAGYIAQFDVAMNPQLVNDVTIGNYPRKIDEYLYMGKPTVATKTKAMAMFAAYCYLAEDQKGYEEAIQAALLEHDEELQEKRKAFAASHSWENSVEEIYKAVAA